MTKQEIENLQEKLTEAPRQLLENLTYCLLRLREVDGCRGRDWDAIGAGVWDKEIEKRMGRLMGQTSCCWQYINKTFAYRPHHSLFTTTRFIPYRYCPICGRELEHGKAFLSKHKEAVNWLEGKTDG